jgi:arsenate reductase (thioredoxin)
MPDTKPRVLFVCTHKAARSQIAEALLRHNAGEPFEVLSAGIAPTQVHRLTHLVLTDIGLDPSGQYAKGLDDFFTEEVCERARLDSSC